jgi:hypothetical protein
MYLCMYDPVLTTTVYFCCGATSWVEIKFLKGAVTTPNRPFGAIVGGAKVIDLFHFTTFTECTILTPSLCPMLFNTALFSLFIGPHHSIHSLGVYKDPRNRVSY